MLARDPSHSGIVRRLCTASYYGHVPSVSIPDSNIDDAQTMLKYGLHILGLWRTAGNQGEALKA